MDPQTDSIRKFVKNFKQPYRQISISRLSIMRDINKLSKEQKHQRLILEYGQPDTCEYCKKTGLKKNQIHWANISQEYKADISDWIRLCASCHHIYDGIAEKCWAVRRKKIRKKENYFYD